MSIIKDILREVFISLRLDLTKNIKYDRLTRKIMKRYLQKDYNCIDVGCHKGEILDLILKYAPAGAHCAFEPIPYLCEELERKYKNRATIFPYALSDNNGETTFQHVRNAPAYSGIKKRRYDIPNPEIEEIKVELKTLDELIPSSRKIHFIKIDVEGGEFGVIKGAKNLLKNNRLVVLFECGKGASDYYGTVPVALYNFITDEIGMKIYTLDAYLKNGKSLNVNEFINHFDSNTEYYFVAASDSF
ncbi:MAG: FkbM family methyltransferase [Bacteroidales bacterium]|nr:FkbM family methyltransferase [Bacteroidales bacterium]